MMFHSARRNRPESRWACRRQGREAAKTFGPLDPLLDGADAGEIFVELVAILGGELALERAVSSSTKSSNDFCVLWRSSKFFWRSPGAPLPKSRSKTRRGFGSGVIGVEGRAPREIVLIGAGVAAVAAAGLAHAIAGKFERRKAREVADLLRRELVDGDARLDVRAVGLAGAHAGEKRGVGARVVAGTVVAGLGVFMIEAADDLDGTLPTPPAVASCGPARRPDPRRSATKFCWCAPFGKINEGHAQAVRPCWSAPSGPGPTGRGPPVAARRTGSDGRFEHGNAMHTRMPRKKFASREARWRSSRAAWGSMAIWFS